MTVAVEERMGLTSGARLPAAWVDAMDLPLIVAPMFLVSSVALVAASALNGVVGAIPASNARTSDILDTWLGELAATLAAGRADGRPAAPWALNLTVHRTNARLPSDLAVCIKHRVPLVITALGSPRAVVDQIHAYGGVVFADVNTPDFARKAADAGVDGLVLITAGAGGHTGQMAAPAFVAAVREFWDGIVVVSGGMTEGRHLRAAQAMGADLAYMGTRFIASHESSAVPAYKDMLVASTFRDIICTAAITGAPANKLRPSLVAAGLDPDNLPARGGFDLTNRDRDVKAWKDLWSAGHGVGRIAAVDAAAAIIATLRADYAATVRREQADPFTRKALMPAESGVSRS
ncbi:MAG TPA: nitronate monooxygenase [Hyphomicrobiales bacterium]|nr:nitronate monooxygenase [Hyphomicrobiales bacterium]